MSQFSINLVVELYKTDLEVNESLHEILNKSIRSTEVNYAANAKEPTELSAAMPTEGVREEIGPRQYMLYS